MIFKIQVLEMNESKNSLLKKTLMFYFLISQILWVAIAASISDIFMPTAPSAALILAAVLAMTAGWVALSYLSISLWVMTWRRFLSDDSIRKFADMTLKARSPVLAIIHRKLQ